MSNKTSVLIGIVAIVAILGLIYWWSFGGQNAMAPSQPAAVNTANTAPAGATGATGAAQLTSGNSNANLNQDLQTITAQSNGFASDSASMNQSLTDQPVTQSQL